MAIESESDDEEESDDEDSERGGPGVIASGSSPEDRNFLGVPRKGDTDDTAGGLGESLEQMSISPRYQGNPSAVSSPMVFIG